MSKEKTIIRCLCGGHYIDTAGDRKQHYATKMHISFVATQKPDSNMESAKESVVINETVANNKVVTNYKGYDIIVDAENTGYKYVVSGNGITKTGKSTSETGALKNAKKVISRL
jgi:hypothetical protein